MAYNVVNLDALIPRENFDVDVAPAAINRDPTVALSKLKDSFFVESLRKPDFQRETYQWSPTKVVDLIRSFLDADLIPAVILWQSGPYIFVIDGAHRLSALLAWIYDDYGDKKRSLEYFDNRVPEDQLRVAERTRKLVSREIGSFDSYEAARRKPREDITQVVKDRLAKMSNHSLTAQWVLSNDPKVAEDSFFKINQAASPIDPTESRILKARHSANALAARAITRSGGGHKYWQNFEKDIRDEIENLGSTLNKALYEPPMDEGYVKSLDVPVAGRGYNALPFVFDLVNIANDQKITDSTTKRAVKETLPVDVNGNTTVLYLKCVARLVGRITGDHPGSLGLHPLVYFYSRTGSFQPVAFFAMANFLEELSTSGKLPSFTSIRGRFEDFLRAHRECTSNIIHRRGSGSRSLPAMEGFFGRLMTDLLAGKSGAQIYEALQKDLEWNYVTEVRGPGIGGQSKEGNAFSRNTKSAAVIEGLETARRCPICKGFLHRNSMHIDHKVAKREGGAGDFANAQVVHPYCDSTYKDLSVAVSAAGENAA